MTDEESSVRAKSTAMQPKEQQIGFALAALTAVAGVAIGALDRDPLLSGIGLVAAGGLALAVRRGQRVIAAIAALVAGVAMPVLPAQLLFMGYGMWLMMKTSRAQGKINAARPRLTPQQRREARAARSAKSGKAVSPATVTATTRQPNANRRYTPPKGKPGRR